MRANICTYFKNGSPLASSAQNIDISSRTREGIGIFKISANIGSHFKISYKNMDKNIKCLKYWYFYQYFYWYFYW